MILWSLCYPKRPQLAQIRHLSYKQIKSAFFEWSRHVSKLNLTFLGEIVSLDSFYFYGDK
jgi:hypothetical protein